jgi:hypothetical protein
MEDIVRRVESRGIVDGQRRDVGLDAERYFPVPSRESYRDCSQCPSEQTACTPTWSQGRGRVVVLLLPHRFRERRASGRHRALCAARAGRWPVPIASEYSDACIPKVSVLTRGVGSEAMERDDKSAMRRSVSCRSLARTSVSQSPESSEQYPFRIGGWLARLGCKSEAGNKRRADRTPLSQSIPTSRPKMQPVARKCTNNAGRGRYELLETTCHFMVSSFSFLLFSRP